VNCAKFANFDRFSSQNLQTMFANENFSGLLTLLVIDSRDFVCILWPHYVFVLFLAVLHEINGK